MMVSARPTMSRFNANVDLANFRRSHYPARLAFRDLAAEIEHDQPPDDGQQRMHDVFDPYDRGAGGMYVPDGLDQRPAFGFRQAAGDFVEQQQLRSGGERARHLQPLALEQRQRSYRRIGLRDQARAHQNVGTWRRGIALRQSAPVHGTHQQVFKHREALEWLRDLIGASDPKFATLMGAGGRYVAIVETDFAAIGSKAPGDQIEQRRLASTVGADDAERLAGRDGDVEIVRGDHRAE